MVSPRRFVCLLQPHESLPSTGFHIILWFFFVVCFQVKHFSAVATVHVLICCALFTIASSSLNRKRRERKKKLALKELPRSQIAPSQPNDGQWKEQASKNTEARHSASTSTGDWTKQRTAYPKSNNTSTIQCDTAGWLQPQQQTSTSSRSTTNQTLMVTSEQYQRTLQVSLNSDDEHAHRIHWL